MSDRFYRSISMGIMLAAFGAGWLSLTTIQGKADNDESDSRIRQGFELVSDLDLNLHGKNRALVGLGAYLVNGVGGCNVVIPTSRSRQAAIPLSVNRST